MPGNDFKVFMFANDFVRIRTWVLRYPDSETGGDLFGVWTNPGRDAVLHVILGPGRECTHGQYHFYQDIKYLSSVGELLTNNFMLCHIGEWHSHHKLKLCKPSPGDCRTVIRNFPTGACGFLLLIANIISEKDVSVSPYLFEEGSYTYKAGNVQILETIESPFRLIPKVGKALEDGEEEYGRPARGSGTQSQRKGGTRHETTHSGDLAKYGTQEQRPQKSYADASKPSQTGERGTKDGQEVYKPVNKYGEEKPARGSETHSQRSSGSKHETPHSDEQANHVTQEERPQKTYDIIVQQPSQYSLQYSQTYDIIVQQPSQYALQHSQTEQPSQDESKPTVEYSEGRDSRTQRAHRQEGHTSTAVEQSSPSTSDTVDVASCTRVFQWYAKEKGQAFLKETFESLSRRFRVETQEEIKIVRDKEFLQDLSIQLQHHGHSLVITFPYNYLTNEYTWAKLSYIRYHGKARVTSPIDYIKSQTPKDFVADIWSIVKKKCPQCQPDVTHVSSV